jgi:hypothetical protein
MHLAFETKTQGERFMKNKLNLIRLAVVAALSLGVSTFAQADSATPSATPSGPTVSFSGGIDTYYLYNTESANAHSDGITAPKPVDPTGRAFDTSADTFRVGLAKFGVEAKEGKALGHIDLIYGQTADIISSGAGSNSTEVSLESAYVSYMPTSKLTLTMGKCATPIGFEVIESWSNLNYSRSYLYWDTIPVVHSCLRASYAFTDKYSAMVMVANSGWADEKSSSQLKNGLVQFTGNPSSVFGFIATGLVGNRTGAIHTTQNVADLDVNLNPTSKLYVGLDLTYGQTTEPDVIDATSTDVHPYQGVALYASYVLPSNFKLSGRVERLNDKDAVATGLSGYVQEGTLTLSYKTGNFLPRAEFRYDEARNGDNNLQGTQRTYTLSTAYNF